MLLLLFIEDFSSSIVKVNTMIILAFKKVQHYWKRLNTLYLASYFFWIFFRVSLFYIIKINILQVFYSILRIYVEDKLQRFIPGKWKLNDTHLLSLLPTFPHCSQWNLFIQNSLHLFKRKHHNSHVMLKSEKWMLIFHMDEAMKDKV